MSAIAYLHELDAKATTWESRVQIACALAIIEAVQGETGGAEDGRVPVTVSRRSDDKETISFDGSGFTTVRACRDCGVLIVGGPNRCLYCANRTPRLAPVPMPRRERAECACRTGDGPGLHDDGCPVTLPPEFLDGDGRDGFNGDGPFEG